MSYDDERVTPNDGSNLAQLEDCIDAASMYRLLGEVAADFQRVTAERDALLVRVAKLRAGYELRLRAPNEIDRAALVELAAEFRIAGDEWAAVRLETVLLGAATLHGHDEPGES